MTIRIVGLPSQPAFVRTQSDQYVNLADVTRIHDSGGTRTAFTVDTVDYMVTTPLAQTIDALKAAGFTIIEGLV